MSKLYRPAIPVEIKCRVALRQLGEMFVDDVIRANRYRKPTFENGYDGRGFAALLDRSLARLAELFGCELKDLRLDHDPALGLRTVVYHARTSRGSTKVVYEPHANDPEYLRYRPHGTQFAGSHDVKTRIRGEHGQFSDIALIKRERRRQRKETEKKAPRKSLTKPKRFRSGVDKSNPKPKWPKRSFPKRGKR